MLKEGAPLKVGIPKGLLYYTYGKFAKTFFHELGCEVITSNETNKDILNLGVKYSIDEACVPIKVFHGHVASIKDTCDFLFIPRVMKLSEKEFICPKFCGLPEMIENNMSDIPPITKECIYATDVNDLYKSMSNIGLKITKNRKKILKAFNKAIKAQKEYTYGLNDKNYNLKIALLGHPYNVYDKFMNMNIVNKLHKLNIGVITENFVPREQINKFTKELFKRPFWTFAKNSYGASAYFYENKSVDGIIYLSSFACGIDSVVTELIKDRLEKFPFMVMKIDEQTGQVGFDTRLEAFADMIERRKNYEINLSSPREHIHCS